MIKADYYMFHFIYWQFISIKLNFQHFFILHQTLIIKHRKVETIRFVIILKCDQVSFSNYYIMLKVL